MLRYKIKRLMQPVRLMGRRFFLLPSMEEQQFVGLRGCLYTAAQFTTRNYVPGDYLEFGVWKGDSFIKAYHALSRLRREHTAWLASRPTHQSQFGNSTSEHALWKEAGQRFFAFDSFAGLPNPSEHQIEEEWVEGAYACSEEQFKKNLTSEGVDLKNVALVPGFYDKTLTPETKQKLGLRKAAIVHIDCDLYESTTLVLDFVTDLLTQGSVLIFDDWFYNQAREDLGEQRACREWLERNPHIKLTEYWRDIHPISFIVNLKTTPAAS